MRIREAVSKPTCTITHLFMDPNYLTQDYHRPTRGPAVVQDAQLEADNETGGPWENIFRALLRVNRKKHAKYILSENELQNGVTRGVCAMWFNPLDHRGNKAWLDDEKLSRRAPTSPTPAPNEPPVASVGTALRMENPGYGWEDGKILRVLPDGRASVQGGSGPRAAVPKRKVARALRVAHIFLGMNPAGVSRDQEGQRTDEQETAPAIARRRTQRAGRGVRASRDRSGNRDAPGEGEIRHPQTDRRTQQGTAPDM